MGRYARRSMGAVVRRAGIPLMTLGFLVQLGGGSLASAAPEAPNPGAAGPGVTAPGAPVGDAPSATPCAKTVKACARLSTNEAWVTDGSGTVLRGPVRMTHGGRGQETPVGTFRVLRKDAQHVSQEQPGVPMPYSVFFDDRGRAFHGGSLARESAGCVHLSDADAMFFFDHLAVGDSVQIVR